MVNEMGLARAIILATAVLFSGAPAQANPLFDFSTPSGGFDAAQWTYGYTFSVTAPIIVDGIGLLDMDGLAVAHEVVLWKDDETRVASATLPAGGTGAGSNKYTYANIGPVTLRPQNNYVLGASYWIDGDAVDSLAIVDLTAVPTEILKNSDDAQFGMGAINMGSTSVYASFPDMLTEDMAYFGPALRLAAAKIPVPEPLTLALLIAGIAGIGVTRRNRVPGR